VCAGRESLQDDDELLTRRLENSRGRIGTAALGVTANGYTGGRMSVV
jgi:hypothetical protein